MKCNFDNISLEKGMYQSGKSLTEILEAIDPSENYCGTALEGLDAFSRQLKRFDIKVTGRNSDTVEKFFQSCNSSVLFPEYVVRCVKSGMSENSQLNDIVASTTQIDGLDYCPIVNKPNENKDKDAPVPPLVVNINNNLIKLHKRGRTLTTSYEAIRFQRLDLFSVFLKQIGAYIKKAQMADAIGTIILGNDKKSFCESIQSLALTGLIFEDLARLHREFDTYELNTLIASPKVAGHLFAIKAISDQIVCENNKYTLPFGINLIVTNAISDVFVPGFDKNRTLEMIESGGINVDYDKLIDRQFERAAITCTAGFSRIFDDSVKAIKLR